MESSQLFGWKLETDKEFHFSLRVMEEFLGQPVKIFPIGDERFPKYNFLKRRLHSIFPRFKSIIENGELAELIPDGKKRFDEISTAREKLKDSISLYVTGSHSTVSPQMMEKYFFVSMKGMAEYGLVSRSLQNQKFRESIRNIAEQPSVIVHVAEAGDGNTKESFRAATRNLISLLPSEDRNSCVLCTASCEEYSSLEDFNINDVLSDLESMKLMIQSCLQVKVVRVLQLMVDFIDDIVQDNPVKESDQCARDTTGLEPLLISVTQNLKISLSESILKKELDEQGTRRAREASMVWYICRNLESRICQNLSASSLVKPNLVHQLMYKTKLDEKIKEAVEQQPNFYKKNDREKAIFCEDLAQSLSDDLGDFKAHVEEKILANAEDLRQICFEICGVFRQAKLPLSSLSDAVQARMNVPKVPRNLQNSILSLDGVHGCGTINGRLVVHIKEGTPKNMIDMDEIRDKIKTTVGNSMWSNNLEIKQVESRSTTGVSSGKFLRVKLIQNETEGGNVITYNNNSYNYGTLGCFIKGKGQGNGPEFANKMYALSCAHVFSPDYENSVEIGLTDQKFGHFGTVSGELTCRREDMVDIAAILVDADFVDRCNLRLKNVQGYEGWNSILHVGTVGHFIGAEVYKWGAVSGLTEGLIISYDYRAQGVQTLNDDFNILIKCLPTSGTQFSERGDSGTLVCLEDPEGEKIVALSMINGALYNTTPDHKYICSFSCHLHTSIRELFNAANMSFEWCME